MPSLSAQRPELVFALVGAAGVRLEILQKQLTSALQSFGYQSELIQVSGLLQRFEGWTPVPESEWPEYERIKHLQDFAFRVRKGAGAEALARAAIEAIREKRLALTSDADVPVSARAYILQQLKHPKEIGLLRRVYGDSVLVLAGHATRDARKHRLCQAMTETLADEIINRDERERRSDDPDNLGQNTRDTYPLADLFVNLEKESGGHQVSQFVELLFGHPFHTPSPAEVAMYQANAVSLRSSDEGRQVGAVIVNEGLPSRPDLDIIATGLNEVPRAGGGFFWHGMSPDNRNQALGERDEKDRAEQIKRRALTEIIQRLKESNWLAPHLREQPDHRLFESLHPLLKGTQFAEIGEFMRPVHAEMAALIDAARRGVAVQGKTMYVTSFPCHNCAKHIIAAGILRVVYLEPYPKSRAEILHREEMNTESPDGLPTDSRVVFAGFTGVAPRQYAKLFGMTTRGGKNALKQWNANRASQQPRYVLHNASFAYLVSERDEMALLPGTSTSSGGEVATGK